MLGIQLPICSIVFSFFLLIIYYSKDRVKTKETKIFSIMLIVSLIDSIIVSILQLFGFNLSDFIVEILNKIDFTLLAIFGTCIFLYTFLVTNLNNEKLYSQLKKTVILIDVVAIIIMLFLNINIVRETSEKMTVTGAATSVIILLTALYIILSLIILIFNIKNINKKHIPIFGYLLLIVAILVVYTQNPFIIIISIGLTFINYLMYFTIENPDIKMLEKVNILKLQAESANRTKQEFLKQMSHEIATPMNHAIGYNDLIKETTKEIDTKEYSGYVGDALEQIHSININSVTIAGILSGDFTLDNKSYQINPLLDKVIDIVNTNFHKDKQNVKFVVNIDNNIPKILDGDSKAVSQILQQVLSNAFKYTKEGLITLDVQSNIKNNKCILDIKVKDTGIGIKKENMSLLFTAFERPDFENTQTVARGAGLGLSITKKLVEFMNGNIKVNSSYGKGTEVLITIEQDTLEGGNSQ